MGMMMMMTTTTMMMMMMMMAWKVNPDGESWTPMDSTTAFMPCIAFSHLINNKKTVFFIDMLIINWVEDKKTHEEGAKPKPKTGRKKTKPTTSQRSGRGGGHGEPGNTQKTTSISYKTPPKGFGKLLQLPTSLLYLRQYYRDPGTQEQDNQ